MRYIRGMTYCSGWLSLLVLFDQNLIYDGLRLLAGIILIFYKRYSQGIQEFVHTGVRSLSLNT